MESPEASPVVPEVTPYDEGPCSMENIHNKVHEVFPLAFNGIKLIINKGLSPHFQVSHTLALTSGEAAGYRFGATYAGHKKYKETEAYPVLMGEILPNGQLQAQIVDQVSPICRLRYLAQIQKCSMVGQQASLELRNDKYQAGVTLINPDVNAGTFMLAIDTMRRMSSSLYLGSMFFLNRNHQLPGGIDGIWSFGGKFVTSYWQFVASVRPLQLALHSSFHMKVNENLQLAAELESTYQQQSSVATLGYQYDIPKSYVTFKAQVDSNWNVAATMEKRLFPFPFAFSICASGNSFASKYEVGVGLTVG